VEAELRQLRDSVGEARRRFDEERNRTAELIESAFDEDVRNVFLERQSELPKALAELDADLERLVVAHLESIGAQSEVVTSESGRLLRIASSLALPESLRAGVTVAVGASPEHESLHLAHPLVTAAVEAARQPHGEPRAVMVTLNPGAPDELLKRRGGRARLVLLRVRYEGLEPVERLISLVLFEGDEEALAPRLGETLLLSDLSDLPDSLGVEVPTDLFEDAIEETIFVDRANLTTLEAARFDRSLEQVENYVEDRLLLLRRARSLLEQRVLETRVRRDEALSLEGRDQAELLLRRLDTETEERDAEIGRLERRDDDTYRRCRDRLLARRYGPGRVERLFEIELVLE